MNRLKMLREEFEMKQSELGKLLNVKDSAISKYESGKVPLTGETLIKLSEIFNVTTDYLLGVSENRNNYTVSYEDIENTKEIEIRQYMDADKENYFPEYKNRFGNILRDYRQQNNLSISEFSKLLNIGAKLYNKIENGIYFPTLNFINNVSKKTKLDLEYFIGSVKSSSVAVYNKSLSHHYVDFTFSSRFEELCIIHSVDDTNCEEKLLLPHSTYNDIKLNRMPTLSELLHISYAFNVSLDYLIGKIDKQDDKALSAFTMLNNDNKDIIVGEMKKLIKEQNYYSVAAEENEKLRPAK